MDETPRSVRISNPEPELAAQATPLKPRWTGRRLIKVLGPVGIALSVLVGFLAKLKLPAVLLKTGGTMFLSVWLYAKDWGWAFAAGFVGLLFLHECGHVIVAKRFGLKVSAPVFIPFIGAFVLLKEEPRTGWVKSWVNLGGPLLGAVSAVGCGLIYLATGHPFFRALAYAGFLLNLFNLAPLVPLDGGNIVVAISPWPRQTKRISAAFILAGLWARIFWGHPAVLLLLVVIIAGVFLRKRILARNQISFRTLADEEQEKEEKECLSSMTAGQRWAMVVLYFGLAALLALAMYLTRVETPMDPSL